MKYPELFKSDKDWQNNACLNFSHDMSIGYIEGYKIAADRLVEYIEDNAKEQDFLIYPIVFLYRHHLEILLKDIIDKGRQLLDEGHSHPKHHSLNDLWSIAKKIIKKVWNDADEPEDFKVIDHFIKEFTKIDPNSMAFRYPKDKKGDKLLKGIKIINVRHLSKCIDSISELLDGASLGINEYLDNKYEMLANSGFDI